MGSLEVIAVDERISKILDLLPEKDSSYRALIYTENHEIHFWRILPGEWIYPHTHPNSDDIWYIVQGEGEYYITSKEKRMVRAGDITGATPRDIHGIYNSGTEDIIVYSVLAPLTVELNPAPDFEYPE